MNLAFYVREDELSKQVEQQLKQLLRTNNYVIDETSPEVVITIGGDGTFLRACHHYLAIIDQITFIGIHTGTLGFFADYDETNFMLLLDLLNSKKLKPSKYPLLEAHITYVDHKEVVYAINEIRLENPFHTLICNVEIDGSHLEKFRGNGLSVSGVLGSSGYNRSLGGAIIDNTLDVLQLSEIAAIQSNAYRSLGSSLVLNSTRVISVSGEIKDAIIGYDHLHLPPNNKQIVNVTFKKSARSVSLMHYNRHTLIDTIRRAFVID